MIIIKWVSGCGQRPDNDCIGPTTPNDFKLQVAGNIGPETDNTYDLGSGSKGFRDVFCNRGAFNGSDRRFKENIEESDLGLEFILKLNPVKFDWKNDSNGKNYGFIAQELEKTLGKYSFAGLKIPENGEGHYYINYTQLISPMVKALQEQNEKISFLEKVNAGKEIEIQKLKADFETRIKALEDKIK